MAPDFCSSFLIRNLAELVVLNGLALIFVCCLSSNAMVNEAKESSFLKNNLLYLGVTRNLETSKTWLVVLVRDDYYC